MVTKSNASLILNSIKLTFGQNQRIIKKVFPNINQECNNTWTNTEDLVYKLNNIEDKLGESTLKKVGVNVSRLVIMNNPKLIEFKDLIENHLNDLYTLNHLNSSTGFVVEKCSKGYIINVTENPYPILFNVGLLYGFSYYCNNVYSLTKNNEQQTIFLEKIL